jgi:hypothetical protein
LSRVGPRSPQAAFLQWWSHLQYGSWDVAAATYSDGLRSAVTVAVLARALETQQAYFRATKPQVTGVGCSPLGTVLHYRVPDIHGAISLQSITWTRTAGAWQIAYDASLDAELRQSVQEAVQLQVAPTAPQPVKQAISAGERAAQLQGRYLQAALASVRRGSKPSCSGA